LRSTILALFLLPIGYIADSTAGSILAQQQKSPTAQGLERKLDEQTQEPVDDVVRVRTDLVQTSVGVLDKRGQFVDNLRAEDFELRVDGKPYPILFFDRVVNGTGRELSNNGAAPKPAGLNALTPEDASRTVLFFVDDLHLSSESIARTRKMLSNYIEQEMGENDQAVIASASGQLGFLQQLSNEKEVLRAAVERLKYRPQSLFDTERPRMTVFQAQIIEQGDADVRKYFEDVLLSTDLAAVYRQNPQLARATAERQTHSRASRLIKQADIVAIQTLAGLTSAVRSSAQAAGRKLFVFVSDGFLVNSQNPDIRYRLQRVTDAAVRAGAVVYTIQASGLNTTFPDASSDVILIPGTGTGRTTGDDIAVQDPLTELAADTGGKALLNANDLNLGVKRALQDSNDYYLLAWRPQPSETGGKDFHKIEVSVKGHSDLSVRLQRGFFGDDQPAAIVPAKADKSKTPEASLVGDLAAAIRGRLQNSSPLQTHLLVNYLDVPNHGPRLSVLMQVKKASESLKNGKPGTIDVAGVIYNESGKVAGSFVENLRSETNAENSGQYVTYLNQFDVKPGLYQVRVAARDSEGVAGMTMQWVTVPELESHHLALSSLLIGERDISSSANRGNAAQLQKALLKIDKRFLQNSRLRVLTFIYNATRDANNPSPRLNARIDVFHGNKVIVSTPTFVIDTANAEDPARIPYAGELNLTSLAKGRYRLRVTIIDLGAKAFASQEAAFEIE
jgi:VWFA-related protein